MSGQGDGRYVGKFRGVCRDNVDPQQRGRIFVDVPDVKGSLPSSWAEPAMPVAGQGMGMFALPPVGAGVWIEFESGDPDYPIWSGCWWGSGSDVPPSGSGTAASIPHIALETPANNSLLISDAPGPDGGILITSTSGATIAVNDQGITIDNGQGATITLSGPTVSVNGGALTVT